MKIYTPSAGEHIAEACNNAVALAHKTGEIVRFRFNDIDLQTGSRSTGQTLLDSWTRRSNAATKKWKASPECKAQEAAWARKLARYQSTVDKQMKSLPKVARSHNIHPLILWLKVFGNAAGWRGIECDKSAIVEHLEAAGYVANEYVGEMEAIANDSHIKARYLVGQYLECLKGIGCWPDILPYWCEKWLNEVPA